MRVTVVIGTRPEAIKMCPLALELQKSEGFAVRVVSTGQHRDMLGPALAAFGVVPDAELSVMEPGQGLAGLTSWILEGVTEELGASRPDAVLVHGDTTTALASALAAFYARVPVGHVEAGLRTKDLASPFPEEANRQLVDRLSRWRFEPTEEARENLLAEGCDPASVWVTGNTGIDALRYTVRDDWDHPLAGRAEESRLVLLTAHRRESLGEPMRAMFRAIRSVVEAHPDVRVVYPVHLNPAVREAASAELSGCGRVMLVEPMSVVDFHNLMARSYMVLTDSGGIQEEAPHLGKPVLVMRDVTERPEGVAAGTLRVVGTAEGGIATAFKELLDDPTAYEGVARAMNPYGDGHASERIAETLKRAQSA